MTSNSPEPHKNGPSPVELPPGDLGYVYDPHVVVGSHGEIKVSPAVQHACTCGGKPPYQVFERPDAEPTWCRCRPYRVRIRQIERFIAESGIPDPFQYKFLDSFQDTHEGKLIQGAHLLKQHLSTLVEKAQNRETTARSTTDSAPQLRGYFFWGKPGVGKTFFSYIALNELMFRSARPGRFISLSKEFFQTLRFAFEEKSPMHGQSEMFLKTLYNVPFLVIDDFGVQRNTEWEMEMLYNLVDSRYAHRRFTIITTNQNVDKTKELAEGRLYSRFVEMCYIIHIQAPDYREYSKKTYEI